MIIDDRRILNRHIGKTIICVDINAHIDRRDLDLLKNINKDTHTIISINWCKDKLPHVDIVMSSDINHLMSNEFDILSLNPDAILVYITSDIGSNKNNYTLLKTLQPKQDDLHYAKLTDYLRINALGYVISNEYKHIVSSPISQDETFSYGSYSTPSICRSDGFAAIHLSLQLSPIKIILIGYEYGQHYQSKNNFFKKDTYLGDYQYAQLTSLINNNTQIINCSNQIYFNFDNIDLNIALDIGTFETPPWINSWDGETIVITSNGPSLSMEQCRYVNEKQKEGKCKIIAIKNSFSLFDKPDIIFTDCCTKWWETNHHTLKEHNVWASVDIDKKYKEIPSTQYSTVIKTVNSNTQSDYKKVNSLYDLKHKTYGNSTCSAETLGGLCFIPGVLQRNTTSGFTAINLAYHLGAKKIILLGYDYSVEHGDHWFGKHSYIETKTQEYIDKFWVPPMEQIKCDIPIINCSTHTAIKNFKRSTIYDEI